MEDIMSFKTVKAEDLLFVAREDLGIDLPEGATKPVAIAAIAEAGLTWEKAVELSPTLEEHDRVLKAKEEEKRQADNVDNVVSTSQLKETSVNSVEEKAPSATDVVASVIRPAKTLIRMDRENPTFQIRGYKFTQQSPFALVTEEDAEYLVDLNEGFYYATPKEAAEFYG
jgi:hypothetical protein